MSNYKETNYLGGAINGAEYTLSVPHNDSMGDDSMGWSLNSQAGLYVSIEDLWEDNFDYYMMGE